MVRSNGVVQQWNTFTNNIVHTSTEHLEKENSLRAIEFNSDFSNYMLGGSDKAVYLYDAKTFQTVMTCGDS